MPSVKTTDTTHRVCNLNTALRQQMKATKTRRKSTLADLIEEAVETELTKIVKRLASLGISQTRVDVGPVKLPLTDTLLRSLRSASGATGIPQGMLLTACLTQTCRRKRRAYSARTSR